MILKDYRECFAADLRDPEFQRELVMVSYEEDGTDGLLRALREITPADQDNFLTQIRGGSTDFSNVRSALNALGLDMTLVRK